MVDHERIRPVRGFPWLGSELRVSPFHRFDAVGCVTAIASGLQKRATYLQKSKDFLSEQLEEEDQGDNRITEVRVERKGSLFV